MARTYRLGSARRLVNVALTQLLRMGIAVDPHMYLLSVAGRRSGRIYTTPVILVENGERFLVAPYGEVGWVKNARASGRVTLSRGRHRETVGFHQVEPAESAPVLRAYLKRVRVTRPFFDVTAESSLEDFAAEAARHPVFLIEPI